MGDQVIHAETTEPQGVLSTYTVIAYRGQALPEDYRSMIYSRWLRSLRHGNDFMRLIVPQAYYTAYQKLITAILNLPETTVRIAVLSEDHDVALGFSVSRGTILEYVHVHKDQRKRGIGTNLVPKDTDTITHLTKTGLAIWGTKYGKWKFNPFA